MTVLTENDSGSKLDLNQLIANHIVSYKQDKLSRKHHDLGVKR